MIYSTFAQVYDRLMDTELYNKWRDYLQERVKPEGQALLELACGSGNLAVKLSQAGFDVTGFDLSEEMLTLAEQKQDAAQQNWPLIQGDMQDLSDLENFSVVTCFDDSICYMPSLAAVQTVFEQVYQHLLPGGRFFFDAHSLYQMDEVFPGYMYNDKTEETAFMWSSYEGEVAHSVEHDLTFFIWDDEISGYQVLNELHHERTYPIADWERVLKQVGFKQVRVSADFGQNSVQPDSVRWFFEAEK